MVAIIVWRIQNHFQRYIRRREPITLKMVAIIVWRIQSHFQRQIRRRNSVGMKEITRMAFRMVRERSIELLKASVCCSFRAPSRMGTK